MFCAMTGCVEAAAHGRWYCARHYGEGAAKLMQPPPLPAPPALPAPPPGALQYPIKESDPTIITFPCDPTPGVLDVRVVDMIIERYHTFRPTASIKEFKMPSWARCFFFTLAYSGKITLGDLCRRAALRPDVVRDLHTDKGQYNMVAAREGTKRANSIRFFLHVDEDPADRRSRVRSTVYLRDDVAAKLNSVHLDFAQAYCHMHPQMHIAVRNKKRERDEEAKVEMDVATGMSEPPEKRFELGQAAIDSHANSVEYYAPELTVAECARLDQPPFKPVSAAPTRGLFELTICVDLTCQTCYPFGVDFEGDSISTPTELFEPLDFFLPSWRDLPDEYGAYQPCDQRTGVPL